jgi:hypothetical protein
MELVSTTSSPSASMDCGDISGEPLNTFCYSQDYERWDGSQPFFAPPTSLPTVDLSTRLVSLAAVNAKFIGQRYLPGKISLCAILSEQESEAKPLISSSWPPSLGVEVLTRTCQIPLGHVSVCCERRFSSSTTHLTQWLAGE